MSTTLEEARMCSKCGKPGDIGGRQPTDRPGYDVIIITCRTELCPWFETGWPVEIQPDGTIPDPMLPGQVRGRKKYPLGEKASEFDKMIEQVNAAADTINDISRRK